MKKFLYNFFGVFALSIILISCGAENELIAPIKKNIKSQNYEAALIAADSALIKQPENGQANYYKAYALSKIAVAETEVAARHPLFEEMRENLLIAKSIFDTLANPPFESLQISDLILDNWVKEYTFGVDYLQNDSVRISVNNPIELSILHFKNSLAINPDSIHSYQALTQAYFQSKEYEMAAKYQQEVISNPYYSASAYDYDRLGNYYLLLKDYESVLNTMNTGLDVYPDSIFLVEKKVDALFNSGDKDGAVEVLKGLINSNPSNPQYYIVLGTQIVNRVGDLNEELSKNNDRLFELRNDKDSEAEVKRLKASNDKINEELEILIVEAETSLLKATQLAPNNYLPFNALGILYQNKSAALFEKRNATVDNEKAAVIGKEAQAVATKALENYELAYALQPENNSICTTLFRLYTQLGNKEKSNEFSVKCN